MKIKNGFMIILMFISGTAYSEISVIDDSGNNLLLDRPAGRVISLAPHITELLYAVGGEEKIIAAVDYSNYPEQAKKLPRVGSGYQLDLERIIALKPDLIIAWKSGNNLKQLNALQNLGFKLYLSEPASLQGIAKNLHDMGVLLGNEALAEQQANDFLNGLSALKKQNKHSKKIKVFYQVWDTPLFTVNGHHLISKIINICGGENIFKDLSIIAPQVSIEAVLARNPQIIIAGSAEDRVDWLKNWERWQTIDAVKNKQLYGIDADLIVRHTPRILQGAILMCEQIEKARNKKAVQ